jgi:hypothetical protein
MNERIFELAEQATRKAMWPGDPDAGELNAEKFAELIVRECQTVVEWAISVDSTIDRVSVLIQEHFGVEL